ncbi:hypothetical protein ACT691_18585 [Vibrio metschnikovii]
MKNIITLDIIDANAMGTAKSLAVNTAGSLTLNPPIKPATSGCKHCDQDMNLSAQNQKYQN